MVVGDAQRSDPTETNHICCGLACGKLRADKLLAARSAQPYRTESRSGRGRRSGDYFGRVDIAMAGKESERREGNRRHVQAGAQVSFSHLGRYDGGPAMQSVRQSGILRSKPNNG